MEENKTRVKKSLKTAGRYRINNVRNVLRLNRPSADLDLAKQGQNITDTPELR